jgi:hypothetical protein
MTLAPVAGKSGALGSTSTGLPASRSRDQAGDIGQRSSAIESTTTSQSANRMEFAFRRPASMPESRLEIEADRADGG